MIEGAGRHFGLVVMVLVTFAWVHHVPADAWIILAIYPSLIIYASMVRGHARPWTLACQSFIAGNVLTRIIGTIVYWFVYPKTFWLADLVQSR